MISQNTMRLQEHSINKACSILNKGGFVCTTSYTHAIYYKRIDGTIWMYHFKYGYRKYFNSIKDLKRSNKDMTFYRLKRQFNPYFRTRFCFYEEAFDNRTVRGYWSYPHYGSSMRTKVLKLPT